jgi:hypothetical protein
MDRLAAHVIATAALTLTLATVPVLFADASPAAPAASSTAAVAAPAPATADLPTDCRSRYGFFYARHRIERHRARFRIAPAVYDERRGGVGGDTPPDRLCA